MVDGLFEVHGVANLDGITVSISEQSDKVRLSCHGATFRHITPAAAHYLAAKLHRAARRVAEREIQQEAAEAQRRSALVATASRKEK